MLQPKSYVKISYPLGPGSVQQLSRAIGITAPLPPSSATTRPSIWWRTPFARCSPARPSMASIRPRSRKRCTTPRDLCLSAFRRWPNSRSSQRRYNWWTVGTYLIFSLDHQDPYGAAECPLLCGGLVQISIPSWGQPIQRRGLPARGQARRLHPGRPQPIRFAIKALEDWRTSISLHLNHNALIFCHLFDT